MGIDAGLRIAARVLVELHKHQAFEAGLVVVGTLAYMAWLNELGAIALTTRTLDIDLARAANNFACDVEIGPAGVGPTLIRSTHPLTNGLPVLQFYGRLRTQRCVNLLVSVSRSFKTRD